MATMRFVRSGKYATHIDKASGAYDYRKIIDQLCVETYRGQDVLVLDGCRLVVPEHKRMPFSPCYTLATAASPKRTAPPFNYTTSPT